MNRRQETTVGNFDSSMEEEFDSSTCKNFGKAMQAFKDLLWMVSDFALLPAGGHLSRGDIMVTRR